MGRIYQTSKRKVKRKGYMTKNTTHNKSIATIGAI